MNYSETCSMFSAEFASRIPVLDELAILIPYMFLLREPSNLLSDHYVAVLVYRTLVVCFSLGIVGVCLNETIQCFSKVFVDMIATFTKIIDASVDLCR
jgi:hypothetical protein